jgi:anthranilate synthase/aminodeoxychorismate synthase-like glutamine amidotransferase
MRHVPPVVKPNLVVVDNYDSFTFNLVQSFRILGADCAVLLNDAARVEDVAALSPDGIVLSPGPGAPEDAGITLAVLAALGARYPILGVCLGHQALAHHFGARVVEAERPMHGKTSDVEHDGRSLYRGLPSPLRVARYHSLVVDEESLPACLEVSARALDRTIMGLRHRSLPLESVQFHPESILTSAGLSLLGNWMEAL